MLVKNIPHQGLTNVQKILSISIYINFGASEHVSFGRRAKLFPGRPDLKTILLEERAAKYIEKTKDEIYKRGEMLVMGKKLYFSRREGANGDSFRDQQATRPSAKTY